MSGTMHLTDDAIRAALSPASDVRPPVGLADAISAAVVATPQRGAGILGWPSTPLARRAQQLVFLGLLLLGLLLAALLFASQPTGPRVTTYHGDTQRTGVMPGPGPADMPPTIAWENTARGPFGPWSPAVVEGKVFVADQRGFISAYDEATGDLLWQVDTGASINSGASVADGLVIVGNDAGVMSARDADSGVEAWTFTASAAIRGSVAVVDRYVYFGSVDGKLYALSLDGTSFRWPAVQTAGSISRAIAMSDGLIYAGSGGATGDDPGTLAAWDASSGEVRWSAALEPGNTSTPSVADGNVYVAGGLDSGAADHLVYAFDALTGEPAWATPFAAPSNGILLLGAVADGHLYLAGTDGLLYVLDARSGMLEWSMPIQSSLTPNAGIVGQTLYLTSDDRQVHAIDVANRVELWALPVTGTPSAPAVVDGAIFVNTSSGEVIRIGAVAAGP